MALGYSSRKRLSASFGDNAVACENEFDMKSIETWSNSENMDVKFLEFKLKLYRSV